MSIHSEDALQSSSGSFWEKGQYRRTVKRIEDAHSLCNDLAALIHDRSELEKTYAKNLKAWSKKWDDHLQKGPEYGTSLGGWSGLFAEADSIADLHQNMRHALMTEVYPQIKQWQKEYFHKSLGRFKESKEMEEGFRKAQKPWKQRHEKVEKSQKEYYAARKNERSVTVQKNNASADTSLSPDQLKKLQDRVDKAGREVSTTRERYNASLSDLNAYNAKYMEDMTEVYNKCQDFEEKRLKFFKEMMFGIHKCLDLSSNHEYPKVYTDLHSTISTCDHAQDLRWWSQNHGVNMPMHWPEYEEWSPEMKQISSKRNTGTAFEDGVTLKRRTVHADSLPVTMATSTYANQQSQEGAPAVSSSSSAPNGNGSSVVEEEHEEDDGFFKDDGQPGTPMIAIYDYKGVEKDELSFKTGDRFEMLQDEDEQGWCKGRLNGKLGLYPASYARQVRDDEL